MKINNHFFAMISRMKYINRWGLMKNVKNENLAEHSLDVTIIAHALAIIKNKKFNGDINADKVAVMAVFHDISETITGDMPTPVKYYNKKIITAYHEIEEKANNKLIGMLPDEFQKEYRDLICKNNNDEYLWKIVKAADKISALIKCIEEKRMGNTDFESAYKSLYDKIKEMNMQEVDYFIEEFLPSYSLTLDEQQLT